MNAEGTGRLDSLEALKRHFGFGEFRPAQEEIIQELIAGRDALVVMPTGGGKSLCYQLPALVREGAALVISPLIALMKDQVDALRERGLSATMINSTVSLAEQRERIAGMQRGDYDLVYVAPERFRSPRFVDALHRAKIAFVAVDEAHCLSQWGHDFRPDYLRLREAFRALGRPQVAAFTATATREVRQDILNYLELRDPIERVTGFRRPNLHLRIREVSGEAEKYDRLKQLVEEHKTGIVYCASRKRVEEVSEEIIGWGVPCAAYHGGMHDKMRESAQADFLSRRKSVAVATNAFGMGIDRADIRFVAHFEIPGSVEAFYQEAGRAGRDGLPAVCELLFNYADTRIQEFFIDGNNPSPELISEIYESLKSLADKDGIVKIPVNSIVEMMGRGTNPMAVSTSISVLTRHGAIDRFDLPGQRVRGTRIKHLEWSSADLKLDREALAEKERRDRAKLQAMVNFAYSRGCRQGWILDYFGEETEALCGTCDQCEAVDSGDRRGPAPEENVIVRKALSGVARMSNRRGGNWEPRFGRVKIIQMLLGSRAREILEAGLDKLSTYGLLRDEGNAYLNALFRELERAGLIQTFPGEYPLVTLTSSGEAVMKGRSEYLLEWPERRGAGRPAEPGAGAGRRGRVRPGIDAGTGQEAELLAALKKLRARLAAQTGGKVPAYVIFPNLTLQEMARRRPATVEEARELPGVGDYRARRYLKSFLEVISEFEEGLLAD